jgi:tRNA wybutosine-synthesizing protein 5
MVEAIQNITELDFYRNFFSRKPVVLKDAIRDTSCFKTWSYEHLKNKIGSRSVNVRYIETGIFNQDSALMPMNFDALIDRATSVQPDSRSYYLQATSIHSVFPELVESMAKPQFMLDSDLSSSPLLWIGAAGCVSPLHYDHYENFLVQVRGTKSLTMFPPSDTAYLYPNINPPRHLSAINLENVDIHAFPLFPNASPVECTICAGDILYIPPNWWHHVRTIEASISINYWFERFDILPSYSLENASVDTLIADFQKFLNHGLSIDHRDVEGEFLLIKAVKYGYKNVVEALLKLGADVNCTSLIIEPGKSASQIASQQNRSDILALLTT